MKRTVNKKLLIFILIFFILFVECIFSFSLDDFLKETYSYSFPHRNIEYTWERKIKESDVPMPEKQFELPRALIGDFIMTSAYANIEITIYPNNKFILIFWIPGHFPSEKYGYVTKIDDIWYFASFTGREHFNGKFFSSLTTIYLNSSGFSFFHLNEERYISSIRRENIPKPKQIADITISARTERSQYFYFNDSQTDRIDYNDLVFTNSFYNELRRYQFHQLEINNGIVEIYNYIHKEGEEKIVYEGARIFLGFMEILEENEDSIKGIIKFVNGIPYYYTTDGTAEIEIKNDGSILITMTYKNNFALFNNVEAPFKIQFPAKLVLEF